MNRDRTTDHSIRQNVAFHVRDHRVLRGCSNRVQEATPLVPSDRDQRAKMARVIFISRKKRNAIFAPLHRLVRQVSAAGSYSYLASRYSYSRRYSDTPLVRCISRVSIDTIRFRSVLPRQFESSSIASHPSEHHELRHIQGPTLEQFQRIDSCP